MAESSESEINKRESSIRWQGRSIEQFGYTLNLVLGLSVAGIGYESSLFIKSELERAGWQNCLLSASLLALVVSVAAGLWCTISRLRDFRVTAEVARQRENGTTPDDLQRLREKADQLGQFSWTLLWCQLWSFAIGILLLVVVIMGAIGSKV